MKHFYCRYRNSKIIKVDWSFVESDLSRFEIEPRLLTNLEDIPAIFEEHLSKIKKRRDSLPCFVGRNICVLKYSKEVNTAFIYFYDLIEVQFNNKENCYYSVLTIRKVKQGASGTCCFN